ncbi:MAG: hypothetical protein IKB97_02185 [Bacteroidaceae bacterium]|nr:hypothetical protein [Bacteroidaceae bacterium]MBR2862356.1 hypothetical protein [Bacteroidaceae bacterium]
MNPKKKSKAAAREARQERQARRVVNGIFIGLIAIALLFCVGYYVWSN